MTEEYQDGLPVSISAKSVTVVLPNGQNKTVKKESNPALYNNVLGAIRENRWEDVINLLDVAKGVAAFSKGAFEVVNGTVQIGGKSLPNALSTRILDFLENHLPFEPLLKFWNNLQENPSFHSVQQLYGFLEANDHPITPDGCFIAYRKVTKDFKDFRTKKFDNSIGASPDMPRNEVNEDPEKTCAEGLHVANYEYAHKHYYPGDEGLVVAVKVHPKDVVAVPNDYNGAKMRVCKFTVLQVVAEHLNKQPLYKPENCGSDLVWEKSATNFFELYYTGSDEQVLVAKLFIKELECKENWVCYIRTKFLCIFNSTGLDGRVWEFDELSVAKDTIYERIKPLTDKLNACLKDASWSAD